MSTEPVVVATEAGDVELSASTATELVRRLQVLKTAREVAQAFADGAPRPVELDAAARKVVFDELTFWLDGVSPSSFPPDARSLFRALAGEAGR